jgi:hypothetical protein
MIASIGIQLESIPSPPERAWLGALAAAGSRLTWSGDIAPAMVGAQPIASPAGGTNVTLAVPHGVPVVLGDEVGVIDTVTAGRYGVGVILRSVTNQLTASAGGSIVSTAQSDSVVLRRVLIIGNAGWESKFIVAALEEAGWKVDARIRVATNVEVAQGSAVVIDTARYSAVIALDGASSQYASRIIEFARTGGGVVLAAQASRVEALAVLRSGTAGRATADPRAAVGGPSNLGVLAISPIRSLRSDATALETRSGSAATAARRVGAGRTLQIGYEDTWGWRMAGDVGVRGHREWWTELVSSVAHAPRTEQRTTAADTDEAPVVGLVSEIGPRAHAVILANPPGSPAFWIASSFALLAFGLVVDVASRRSRGES